MTQTISTPVTHAARLLMPTDFDVSSPEGELQMAQRIARHGARRAPNGAIDSVDFRRCGGGEAPGYDLSVTGASEEDVLAELARLALAVVVGHPVTHVAWLPENAVFDRHTFLDVLCPTTRRPVHRARRETDSGRQPGRRPVTVQADRALETAIRAGLCSPVAKSEIAQMRTVLGIPGPQRRLASAALAITSAVMAMNASGAMAGVFSMVGMP